MATTIPTPSNPSPTPKLTRREKADAVAFAVVSEVASHFADLADPDSIHAGIVRMSYDRDLDGHGVARDALDILEEARRQGIRLRPDPATGLLLYVDNDASASKFGRRKHGGTSPRIAYGRLMAELRSGRVTHVLFTKVDRFARDLRELEEVVDIAEDAARRTAPITFQPLTAGTLDLNSAASRGIARMMCVFAQMESEVISERTRNENRSIREAGDFVGSSVCYGYKLDGKGKLAIVEEEADVLREAVVDVIAGVGLAVIAERWEAAGIPRPKGARGAWDATQVRQRLDRPTIAGLVSYQPPPNSDGTRAPRSIVGEGSWDAIVDSVQWDRLQARLAANRSTYGGPSPRTVYSGLFHCPCGGAMYRHKRRGSTHVWTCLSARPLPGQGKDGLHGCGRNRIDGPEAEAWVDAEVVRRLTADGIGDAPPSVDTDALRAKVAEAEANLALYEAWRSSEDGMDPGEYRRLSLAERKKLEAAKLRLRTAQAENLGLALDASGLLDLAYEDLPEDKQRRLVVAAFPDGLVVDLGHGKDVGRIHPPVASGSVTDTEEENIARAV